jgi:hypothetical protein
MLLIAVTTPALAGGTATVSTPAAGPHGPGEMQVAWGDGETLRLGFARQDAYLILRDGEIFAISNAGGQTMVIPLTAMTEMAQGMPGAPGPMPDGAAHFTAHEAESVSSVEATGRTETVAGIDGEVYEITWVGRGGATNTDTAVLSDDPLAVEFSDAFRAFAEAGGGGVDPRSVWITDRGLGVLRYGDDFRVLAISGDTPPPSTFDLPGPPLDLQDMMQGLGRQTP